MHALRVVLAGGAVGARALPFYLVAALAIPGGGNCCTWGAGPGMGSGTFAGAIVERAIPGVTRTQGFHFFHACGKRAGPPV